VAAIPRTWRRGTPRSRTAAHLERDGNVVWKTPIAGSGWSSAVIQGNLVWITTTVELPLPPEAAKPEPKPEDEKKDAAPDAEKKPATPAKKPPIELRAVCLDRESGKILHNILIFTIADRRDP
jgi:hypothetical protein